MMDYKETVEYLFASTPVFEKIGANAYKEGLSTTHALDAHLFHPHQQYKTIHVAGTNGKGSVSHTLAAILQASGLKVGLFTSPHLVDFRERIRVDGVCVSEQFVIDFVERHRAFFEPLHPSFFELTTAMAFEYFAESHVDIAVVEVGLGGRLDCTNIIHPILSIITNISLDHTQFLGDTLAMIAGEKAGIMKQGVPTVIGEGNDETRPVFEARAAAVDCPIIFAEDTPVVSSCSHDSDGFPIYHTTLCGDLRGQLCGDYQQLNANTILTAVGELAKTGITLCQEHIARGFGEVCEMTGLMGRWQTIRRAPAVVCDTGHNVGGWRYLARQLANQPCRRMHIVFGMVDDKDITTVMSLLPQSANYYFTQASSKRAINAEKVKEIGLNNGLKGESYPTVKEAFAAAIENATEDDFIFVGGSSYIVADLLEELRLFENQEN